MSMQEEQIIRAAYAGLPSWARVMLIKTGVVKMPAPFTNPSVTWRREEIVSDEIVHNTVGFRLDRGFIDGRPAVRIIGTYRDTSTVVAEQTRRCQR